MPVVVLLRAVAGVDRGGGVCVGEPHPYQFQVNLNGSGTGMRVALNPSLRWLFVLVCRGLAISLTMARRPLGSTLRIRDGNESGLG
jgi:hypothetical protein